MRHAIFPTLLLGGNELSISLARVLGCNAFALGTLSWFMRDMSDEPKLIKPGLIALSVFHITVAIAQVFNFIEGRTSPQVIIVHSLFAGSFISVLWKRIK
ncbi:MAG: hypothetical protein HC908_11035 [Calothrix sp. SM1_7_51]|nr:hypothetical protein [Calothrix sp. SM1_7_51]